MFQKNVIIVVGWLIETVTTFL
jgi:hypothetical protein